MGWKLLQQFFYQREDLQAKIPANEHSIFVFMLYTAKDDGTAIYPSLETIARITHHSVRQARTIVSNLEKDGFFERVATGRGRGNLPLWHVPLAKGPLGQENWITPKPLEKPLADAGQQDRRGQKPRAVRLVAAEADDDFLDVDLDADQRTGKEIVAYHQSLGEYQEGYTPRAVPALRLVPQPGVKISEVAALPESVQIQMEEFRANIGAMIQTKRAELAERKERVKFYIEKIPTLSSAASRRISENMKEKAEQDVRQLQIDLAELEEMLTEQQVQRREVL